MIDNLTALGLMMNSYYGHCKSSLNKQFAVVSQGVHSEFVEIEVNRS